MVNNEDMKFKLVCKYSGMDKYSNHKFSITNDQYCALQLRGITVNTFEYEGKRYYNIKVKDTRCCNGFSAVYKYKTLECFFSFYRWTRDGNSGTVCKLKKFTLIDIPDIFVEEEYSAI